MAPIAATTSLERARVVDQLWFSRYPRPAQCVFDQGSEFKKEFLELLHSYGVHAKPITSKSPAANAIVERIHLVIGDKMRTSQINSADEWTEFCANVVFATRASFHTTMQATPGEMSFGRQMLFNLDHLTDWAAAHQHNIRRIQLDIARENADRIHHEYSPGDKVRIHFANDKPRIYRPL
ncbi:TPA: hypothetical protein N0F65_000121 [Lagenidium giganteum]|uniref:Integrase catalytic domain-containing protein n=1 Tax=Lagenidium giganteum TaxID=4803 RepID=A0AAV2YTR2_9STRA|nr:TPA: hypothetical protein N0F65_000121 [Lagenidium giganteum]